MVWPISLWNFQENLWQNLVSDLVPPSVSLARDDQIFVQSWEKRSHIRSWVCASISFIFEHFIWDNRSDLSERKLVIRASILLSCLYNFQDAKIAFPLFYASCDKCYIRLKKDPQVNNALFFERREARITWGNEQFDKKLDLNLKWTLDQARPNRPWMIDLATYVFTDHTSLQG